MSEILALNLICRQFSKIFKMPFYAVARGRERGIYGTWGECEANVKNYSGARYKKFNSQEEAQAFIDEHSTSRNNLGNIKIPKKRTLYENDQPNNHQSGKRTRLINVADVMSSSEDFKVDGDGYVQVYTDGACSSNGRNSAKAGLGVYFGEFHKLNASQPVSGRATNNCGEIQAATMAINKAHSAGIKKLCINTDSKFVINAVTKWMHGWKRNDWKLKSGGPVKNKEDFENLNEALKLINVKWNYVEAHKGILGNERADQLAKDGAARYGFD